MAMALALVHGVRAGLEDNVWFDREQTQLASNKMLLERVLMLGDTLDMTPAPLSTVRKWLKLQLGHGQYGVAAYKQRPGKNLHSLSTLGYSREQGTFAWRISK